MMAKRTNKLQIKSKTPAQIYQKAIPTFKTPAKFQRKIQQNCMKWNAHSVT